MYYFNQVRLYCSVVSYIQKPISLVNISEKVKISGWVKSIRQVKRYTFIHICDNTTLTPLQVVLTNDSLAKTVISFGSYIEVRGLIARSSAPGQAIEMQAKSEGIDYIGPCDSLNYPFKAKEEHTLEYLRQYPHLRARQDKFAAVLKARHELTFALHDYFKSNDFLHVDTPIITTNNCEGTNEIFKVLSEDDKKFFKSDAFLTVSAQLHLESLAASGLSKVYTLGPIFRAEASNTRHHLAEFLMLEAELCPITDINQLAHLVEDLMVYVYGKLADSIIFIQAYDKLNTGLSGAKIDFYQRHKYVLNRDFATLSYSAAAAIIKEHFDPSFAVGSDLGKKHERYLSSEYCCGKPLFILDFPVAIKPFYAAKKGGGETQNPLASSLDLLMSDVGEICGGTLREGNYQTLRDNILAQTKTTTANHPLNWYLELRRFGYPPLAGFGLGYDRLVMNLLGLTNIRDATPFPRHHQSCQL